MATAFYPQNMRSMPASGYNGTATVPSQYISWKGIGVNSNPVGTAPGHIRPLTNKDPGNVFPTGFGLPRPIKHFRKGRVIPIQPIPQSADSTPAQNYETDLINYNLNRWVRSSKGTSLGGGSGGSGLIDDMQDKPGAYLVRLNPPTETSGTAQLDSDCRTCEGVGIVASYYPNKAYLTENPEPSTTNSRFCCNEEYKARRRAIYASTNLSKTYYTTTKQYLQNRCKTYEQRAFNFYKPVVDPSTGQVAGDSAAKPGSALATTNTYVANCFPNGEIYDATEAALANRFMTLLEQRGIITSDQLTVFLAEHNAAGATLPQVFAYITGLSEPQRTQAVALWDAFVDNPYWGVPIAGPSNPNGCKLTVYKPNNPQFAVQGAVSSSLRTLKKQVTTIETNAASLYRNNNMGGTLLTANEVYSGNSPETSSIGGIYKNKAPGCNTPTPFPFQNKKSCYYTRQLPSYSVPISQPSPYRYFRGTVFSSNSFPITPRTYNPTTSGSAPYGSVRVAS